MSSEQSGAHVLEKVKKTLLLHKLAMLFSDTVFILS